MVRKLGIACVQRHASSHLSFQCFELGRERVQLRLGDGTAGIQDDETIELSRVETRQNGVALASSRTLKAIVVPSAGWRLNGLIFSVVGVNMSDLLFGKFANDAGGISCGYCKWRYIACDNGARTDN